MYEIITKFARWTAAAALCCAPALASDPPAGGGAPQPGDLDRLGSLEERLEALEAERARPTAPQASQGFYWDNGLKFKSPGGEFTARIGGRLHLDAGGIDTDDDWEMAVGGREEDGIRLRRARWYMEGTLYEDIEYKWQYDFAGGTNNKFKDAYIAYRVEPVGKIKAGQFKEPMSLEELTSSNYVTFMERASMNALVPQRNIGIQVADTCQGGRITWALGAFRDDGSDTGVNAADGETNVTARVTGLPLYQNGGEDLVHLGTSFSRRQDMDGAIAYSARGASGLLANTAVSTGSIAADGADVAGAEAAWVRGPFSLQGEYVQAMVDASSGSNPDFSGWYAQASWFLTGEHRAYKTSAGAFDRTVTGSSGGPGAWELAARFGELDLSDGSVDGGELAETTFGVNYYLNPFARIMFNYLRMELEPGGGGPDGSADVLQVRFQVDF